MQKTIIALLAGLILILTACDSGQSTRSDLPSDPQELLDAVLVNMQSAETFRMTIEQTGTAYPLLLSFDGINNVEAELRRGTAQFVSPNVLFVNVNLRIGVVVTVDIYSLDDKQWASFPSGAPWYELPPFPNFDISKLMAEDDGMAYAMTNLRDIEILGEATLIDGTTAIHVRGTTSGEVVSSLLFDLIEPTDDVIVNAYINPDDTRFALVEVTMLETASNEDGVDPAMFHIEFYDYDAPQDFVAPLQAHAEATEEA